MKENNRTKKVILMRRITCSYEIEYKTISCINAHQYYREFCKWLLKNCVKDKNDIEKKELVYLIIAYDEIRKIIETKNRNGEHLVQLLKFSKEFEEKIKYFLKKSIQEYESFDELDYEEKDYNYYDNLLSWYSLKIDNTDNFINKLSKLSEEKVKNRKINMKLSEYKWELGPFINEEKRVIIGMECK